jgi:hypothetical protein
VAYGFAWESDALDTTSAAKTNAPFRIVVTSAGPW